MGALGPNKENNQSPTGFYSLMINACGYKLDGKTAPASNNSEYMDIYDDAKETVKFDSLPDDWKCPLCGAPKSMFNKIN